MRGRGWEVERVGRMWWTGLLGLLVACVDGGALRAGLEGDPAQTGRLDAAPPDGVAPDGAAPSDGGPAADRGAADDAGGATQPDQGAERCVAETCNGQDDDCDGQVDEAISMPCGPAEAGVGQCVAGALTCNDGLLSECIGSVGPAAEFCDTVDNDCDGTVDEGLDCACAVGQTQECFSGAPAQNGVGICRPGLQACLPDSMVFGPCTEEVAPRAEECNGRDDDCDGATDEGVVMANEPCEVGRGACARPGMLICGAEGRICQGEPGEPADERCDGIDDDCDGLVDEDFPVGEACSAGVGACAADGLFVCRNDQAICDAAGAEAGVENVCNAVDDDCDGIVDESIPCYEGGPNTEGVGRCRGGDLTCDNGCVGQIVPRAERCDGVDEDCDGAVDEGLGCQCTPGETAPCYEGAGAPGVGICRNGERSCREDFTWSACRDQVGPRAETCDGRDEDCDGAVDEGVTRACGSNTGRCRVGVETCRNGAFDGICDGEVRPRAERCNSTDDDCNGAVDDIPASACGSSTGACRAGTRRCVAGSEVCAGQVGPAAEACNEADDDCDGRTDEGVTNVCGVCGAVPAEICNGQDDDCDGETDEGTTNACGGCGPVPAETCNGQDDDCDRAIDEGVRNACGGCGAVPAEQCNGADDDCDGQTDEGVRNACGDCGPTPFETCNGEDDDCDDLIDENGTQWCNQTYLGRANRCIDGACSCGLDGICPERSTCDGNACCGGQGQPDCR